LTVCATNGSNEQATAARYEIGPNVRFKFQAIAATDPEATVRLWKSSRSTFKIRDAS